MLKTCPKCKQIFDCQHDNIINCHCASVILTPEQRQFIQQNYSGCLCRTCLLEIKEIEITKNI
jgi:hypothetical protein